MFSTDRRTFLRQAGAAELACFTNLGFGRFLSTQSSLSNSSDSRRIFIDSGARSRPLIATYSGRFSNILAGQSMRVSMIRRRNCRTRMASVRMSSMKSRSSEFQSSGIPAAISYRATTGWMVSDQSKTVRACSTRPGIRLNRTSSALTNSWPGAKPWARNL